jgi:hypothetical protein
MNQLDIRLHKCVIGGLIRTKHINSRFQEDLFQIESTPEAIWCPDR